MIYGNRGDYLIRLARAAGVENAQALAFPALERLRDYVAENAELFPSRVASRLLELEAYERKQKGGAPCAI